MSLLPKNCIFMITKIKMIAVDIGLTFRRLSSNNLTIIKV